MSNPHPRVFRIIFSSHCITLWDILQEPIGSNIKYMGMFVPTDFPWTNVSSQEIVFFHHQVQVFPIDLPISTTSETITKPRHRSLQGRWIWSYLPVWLDHGASIKCGELTIKYYQYNQKYPVMVDICWYIDTALPLMNTFYKSICAATDPLELTKLCLFVNCFVWIFARCISLMVEPVVLVQCS
jgi:hypothetical protein